MIWYLLYPLRGTTEAPALSPSNPVRVAFTRYGNYVAQHVILALLISGIVATILIYPIPYLFTNDFTNGASNLPHHVWTVAQPLARDAAVLPDIIMRSIWVHGDYMQALDNHLLSAALELQDELLGPTENFFPAASQGFPPPSDDHWPMPTESRDAVHIVNGLTNQSWFFHSPLLYWHCSRQQILADTDIITTVNERKTQSTSANVTLRHSIVFSGKRFSERRLLAADALVITLLHLRDSPVGRQWEHNAPLLTRKVKDKWDIYPTDGIVESSQVYEFQFRPISIYDIISLALAYGLMFIYFLASLKKLRAIKSKAGLTATVITQILLSIMSSFTVCAILDIDLSRIPRAAYPLVILAISLENMFRVIYAVILSPAENSSSSRVGSAFGQTAHIALASTMQNVAILVGLSMIVSPGVAGFCIFAAIATVFDYFYLSTFFLCVLSVDVRRIELEDELLKASTWRHNHTYGQLKERPSWIYNVLRGKVALSTRIAGTVVMIGFVIIAQWHFFEGVGVLEPGKQLFGTSTLQSPVAKEAASSLKEIHQARSPGSWLRLQDHETAQEVINAIKPSAFSYTAQVYDPLVFVLKESNRTPPQQKKRLLPAAYDFIDHQLAEFVISIALIVPLSPHPLFLIGAISSVYLVSANDGVVQHVFATEPVAWRSLQCEYSDNRYNKSPSGIGFSSLTLGYVEANTQECIVTSYHPAQGSEAIAAFAPSGGAGGGWCTWEEAIETKKRIKDPGTWEIIKERSVIGVRQEAKPCRNTKRADYRRRSATARGSPGAPTRWQAWTAATDGHLEADEVQPLLSDGAGSEELVVVPTLGPKAKIGVRSVAFSLGNTIKVISAGGPERYNADDDSTAESLLPKDNRRVRHGGGSMRGRG
ncbi:hypothetical protein MY5147_006415 [Beauveria neobassiana]